jgi:hypothetical protein
MRLLAREEFVNKELHVSGLSLLLFTGILAGVINAIVFELIMNDMTSGTKPDEVAINTYVLNLFVGWLFFSALFLSKADDEWKKVAEAVHTGNRSSFDIEAPKRTALTIQLFYLITSVLVILSFHLFHISSALVRTEIQFGVGFLVVMTVLVLHDLDDPVTGVIRVPGIPEHWKQAPQTSVDAVRESDAASV